MLKLRVEIYKLNLKLQFNKTFAESNFETFLRVELLNCMLLKPLGVTENQIVTVKLYYFQDLSFSNILSTKIDYYSRKIFENKVVNSIWEN